MRYTMPGFPLFLSGWRKTLIRIFPKSGKDQVLLMGKEKDETERLLRLAVHTLSYADWYSLDLVQNFNLPLRMRKLPLWTGCLED